MVNFLSIWYLILIGLLVMLGFVIIDLRSRKKKMDQQLEALYEKHGELDRLIENQKVINQYNEFEIGATEGEQLMINDLDGQTEQTDQIDSDDLNDQSALEDPNGFNQI